MIINNAINSPLPTSLALGGTNAALTASNGGIFYSTASAGAILSGTATANQTILSGSSAAPSWSTNTYPSTTTANELLYSSSTNVIGGLTTANSSCLVSDNITFPVVIPYPVWSLPMQDGQIVIGGTSGRPEPFNITAGNNITILNRPGAVNIYSTAVPGNWEFIGSQTAFSSFSNTAQTSIDFDNQLLTGYIAYRLVVKNIIPHQAYTHSDTCNLSLRFGTGLGPYIDSPNYHHQLCGIQGNGADNVYFSRNNDDQVLLTSSYGSGGISNDASFGGVSGIIDLFVRPDRSQVANGISRMSYMSNTGVTLEYVNVTSTFQLDISDFYFSVQLFLDREIPIIAGSVSLYGLNTLSDGSENFQLIAKQYANSYLNFLNAMKPNYIAYRLIANNITPQNNGSNLWLRFGNADPMIVSENFEYTYQQFCVTKHPPIGNTIVPLSADFDNQLSSRYTAYRLVLKNVLTQIPGGNLSLRFGTGSGSYVSDNQYTFQICSNQGNGSNNIYLGQSSNSQVLITIADVNGGISVDPTYGGVSGIIDLFVTTGSSQVANGMSKMSYMANNNGILQYTNTTSTFQLIEGNYTSVQLFLDDGFGFVGGEVSLYGLNSLSDGSPNWEFINTQLFDGVPDFFYRGTFGGGFNHSLITLTNIHGINPDTGTSGTIDLFVTPGSTQVANGIARFGYTPSDGITQYINTTSTFQIFLPDNYISVQLLISDEDWMSSGTAYLYGLTTS